MTTVHHRGEPELLQEAISSILQKEGKPPTIIEGSQGIGNYIHIHPEPGRRGFSTSLTMDFRHCNRKSAYVTCWYWKTGAADPKGLQIFRTILAPRSAIPQIIQAFIWREKPEQCVSEAFLRTLTRARSAIQAIQKT